MKALLITALFMEFISVNTASAAEEIHHADSSFGFVAAVANSLLLIQRPTSLP
ncbi:hypothetical protein [Escherichia coli]|uniref:hypothetical protein n=1 Tax=Escherichia coli TaxID=562 RepID=UPI001CDAEA98|nr:hypothetical protein [Escherichia coli]